MAATDPKNQRMPSDDSSERTPSIIVAESSHEMMTRSTSAMMSEKQSVPSTWILLFIVGFQIIDIEDTQFQGTHDEARGIDA